MLQEKIGKGWKKIIIFYLILYFQINLVFFLVRELVY
jgi:hypothetical protein